MSQTNPDQSFEQKVGDFANFAKQGRKFSSDYTYTDQMGSERAAEAVAGAADAIQEAQKQSVQKPFVPTEQQKQNMAALDEETFQANVKNQMRNQLRRGEMRLGIAKADRMEDINKQREGILGDPKMSSGMRDAKMKALHREQKKELDRRYTREDVVREGRVYNPYQFASVPIIEDGKYVGRARVNRKHFMDTEQPVPDYVTRDMLKEMGHKADEGELVMFDQANTPSSVFNFLNREGDGEKLASYAKHLDELKILYTRDMNPLERLTAGAGYVVGEAFLPALANTATSFASTFDDALAGLQNLFYGEGEGISDLGYIGHALGATKKEIPEPKRIKWTDYVVDKNPILVDDFATETAAAVAAALPPLAATVVLSTALSPAAGASTAIRSTGQLAGRAILNGTKGMFANGMTYLAYKLESEKAYLQQGLSEQDARVNAYADAGAGMIATILSTKLLGGGSHFLMKNKAFKDALIKNAKYKVPHIMATGFTREAIQESMDEAFHTALTAALDRADLFGDREDNDFLIGAKELLMAATAGGVIGGTFGAGMDLISVTNLINAEFEKGNVPKVGDYAVGVDGSPLLPPSDPDGTYLGENKVDPEAIDPDDPDGRPYKDSRVNLKKGKPRKVTEQNQAQVQKQWERNFYQQFVAASFDNEQGGERGQLVRSMWDQLRSFSLTEKAVDPDMFGNPYTEKVESGKAKGQRKLDLVSMDADLAYALAGRDIPTSRFGADPTKKPKYKPLKGSSRKDFRDAGLSWVARGMNAEQRAALVEKAQDSVERNNTKLAAQDIQAETEIARIEQEQGFVSQEQELRIRAEAQRDAEQAERESLSALAYLGQDPTADTDAIDSVPASRVGPQNPVEEGEAQRLVIEAARNPEVDVPERLDGAKRSIEARTNHYEKNGRMAGGMVAPPTEEASGLQEAAAQRGIPIVFVGSMPRGEQAIRDRATGIIFVSAEAMQSDPDTTISSVVAHEFVHTLQYQHPKLYQSLVDGLGSADPTLLMKGANEFLTRTARQRAYEQSGGQILLPDQELTDAEIVEMLQREPELGIEIVPYAIEKLVNEGTDAQRQAFMKSLKGIKRNRLDRVIFRMRNLFSSFKAEKSLTQAWKSMKAWDAFIETMETSAKDVGIDPQQMVEMVDQMDAAEARGPPPDGDGPSGPPLNEATTGEQALNATLNLASQTDSLEDIGAAMKEAAVVPFKSQEPVRAKAGTSASVFAQGRTAAAARMQLADIMDPEQARVGSFSQRMLAARLAERGRALQESARKKAKTKKQRAAQHSFKNKSTQKEAEVAVASSILTDQSKAAEAAVLLERTEPTKEQVIRQTIRDMIEEDPEGYEGILPALVEYAVAEGGLTQAQAEKLVDQARNKGHIGENESLLEADPEYRQMVQEKYKDYDPSTSGDDSLAEFDEGGDYDASIPRNFSRFIVSDKKFQELRKKKGNPIAIIDADDPFADTAPTTDQIFRAAEQLIEDDFDAIQSSYTLDEYEEAQQVLFDPDSPSNTMTIDEADIIIFTVTNDAFAYAMDEAEREYQEQTVANNKFGGALENITDGETKGESVRVTVDIQGKGLEVDIGDDGQITFNVDGDMSLQKYDDPNDSFLVLGYVERIVGKLIDVGHFDDSGANFSAVDQSLGRVKMYRRLMLRVASKLQSRGIDSTYQESRDFGQYGAYFSVVPTGDYQTGLSPDMLVQVSMDSINGLANAMSAMGRAKLAPLTIQYVSKLRQFAEEVRVNLEDVYLPTIDERERNFERQLQVDAEMEQLVSSIEEIVAEENLMRPKTGAPAEAKATVLRDNLESFPIPKVVVNVPSRPETDKEIEFNASLMSGKTLVGLLRSRGNLPKAVFEQKFKRDSRVRAIQDRISFRSRQLVKAVREEGGKDRNGLLEKIDTAVKTMGADPDGQIKVIKKLGLSPRSAAVAVAMRNDIDALTQELVASGAIDGAMSIALTGDPKTGTGVGFYVHRSYKVFDDPDWAKKVPLDVRNRAKAFLIAEAKADGKTMTEEEASIIVEQLLMVGKNSDSPMGILAGSKGGVAKDILKKRKMQAPELKELWGEYTDPNVNYTKSMTKMGRLSAQYRFNNETAEIGLMPDGFLSKTATETHTMQYPDDKSKYGKLAGLWVTPDFMTVWEAAHSPEALTGPAASIYYRGVAAAKWGKTIGNPQTHIRNTLGNAFFAIANGHLGVDSAKAIGDVWKAMPFVQMWNEGKREAAQERYNELVELGVVQGGDLADIMVLIDESTKLGMTIPEFVERMQNSHAANFLKDRGLTPAKAVELANRLYQFEDDGWKIYAYSYELSRYERAYKDAGKPVPADLKERVARIIRDTYPNYNMPGRLVRELRRYPFMGTFVSFPSEVIRTSWERLQITATELKDPVLRQIGLKRAGSQLLAYNLGWVLAKQISALLGTAYEEIEAMRTLVPPWSQNSPLIVWKDENGKYNYIDIGYTDPFAMFAKPIYGLLRGETIEESLYGSTDGYHRGLLREVMEPFVQEDMVFGKLLEVYNGETATGRPIYNRTDDRTVKLQKIASHLFGERGLSPGFIDAFYRIPRRIMKEETDDYGRVYTWSSHLMSIGLGLNTKEVNPSQAFSFHARTYVRLERELRSSLTRIAGRAGTVDPAEIEREYARVNKAREENLRGFLRILGSADRVGIDRTRAAGLLVAAGVSKKDVRGLLAGDFRPIPITRDMLDRQIKRSATVDPSLPIASRDEVGKRIRALLRARQAAEKEQAG